MPPESENEWTGRTAVDLDAWIEAELQNSPEPSKEQRGTLLALLGGGVPGADD